jgi:hypothetical protein
MFSTKNVFNAGIYRSRDYINLYELLTKEEVDRVYLYLDKYLKEYSFEEKAEFDEKTLIEGNEIREQITEESKNEYERSLDSTDKKYDRYTSVTEVDGIGYSGIENAAYTSTSTKKITDVVKNLDKDILSYVKYYEILDDFPYSVFLSETSDGFDVIAFPDEHLVMTGVGLIKDKSFKSLTRVVTYVVDNLVSMTEDNTFEFDYIMLYDKMNKGDTALLLPFSVVYDIRISGVE